MKLKILQNYQPPLKLLVQTVVSLLHDIPGSRLVQEKLSVNSLSLKACAKLLLNPMKMIYAQKFNLQKEQAFVSLKHI